MSLISVKKKKILIIGIAGGLAQISARLILTERDDVEIIGVDARNTDKCDKIDGLKCITMNFTRGNFENLFRDNEFDSVFHLARISSSNSSDDHLKKRLDLSVMGTSKILDLCQKFRVRKVVVLSTFHVYGANADNSVFLKENSPLRASINYPELRDVVEMDQICNAWMWKNQNTCSTVILRPCNIIGNKLQNAMTLFLTSPVVLKPIDYNPMFQFIHEFDMARILYQCIDEIPTGVYNVAPDNFISLSNAIELLGSQTLPFPIFLGKPLNSVLKKMRLDIPDYFIDYLRFSCLLSNESIKKHLPSHFFRFSIEDTLKLLRLY